MGTKHAEPVGAYGSTIAGNARAQGRRDLGIEFEPGRLRLIDATVAEITRERLWEKIRSGEPLVLVDALSPISFAGAHLPGAINITPDRVDTLAARLQGGLRQMSEPVRDSPPSFGQSRSGASPSL